MNLKEALQALANGEKVRKTFWPESQFICVGHNNSIEGVTIINKEELVAHFMLQYDGEWELYKEYPMDFAKALAWMMVSEKNICKDNNGVSFKILNNKILFKTHDMDYWDVEYDSVLSFLKNKYKKVKE